MRYNYLILLIFFSIKSLGAEYPFKVREFIDLYQLTYTISNHFPMDKYYYVGIGRSPAPIIATFDVIEDKLNKGNVLATTLPLTWSNSKVAKIFNTTKSLKGSLTQSQWNILKRHFEKYLPTAEELMFNGKTRKILIMDFVNTGTGLAISEAFIKSYYNEKNPQQKVEVLALPIPGVGTPSLYPNWHVIEVPPLGELLVSLVYKTFKPYAQFGEYRIDGPDNLVENPQYQDLKKAIDVNGPYLQKILEQYKRGKELIELKVEKASLPDSSNINYEEPGALIIKY